MALRKACFLDRDGVLIEEENYLSDPEKARLCKGAGQALLRLREAGYALVVVSNQSGVARGYFTMKEVEAVQSRIAELLAKEGASIDAWYNCPHHPKGKVEGFAIDCECRKPNPGMILRAAKEMSLDIASSILIGDKLSDIEAGLNAGCKACALVLSGHGSEQDLNADAAKKAILASGIDEAASKLLSS